MDCHLCDKHIKRRFSNHAEKHIKKYNRHHFRLYPDVKNYLQDMFGEPSLITMSYLGKGELYIYHQCKNCEGRHCNILKYKPRYMIKYLDFRDKWRGSYKYNLYPGSTVFFKPFSFYKSVKTSRIKDVWNRVKKHELMYISCYGICQEPDDVKLVLDILSNSQITFSPFIIMFVSFTMLFISFLIIKSI